MRIATLFSGIGAPEQGAKRVYPNHEVIFACEFDKFARQSYKANYDINLAHFHVDVHDLDATDYKGMVDILIGGSPCQAFSLAGLRKGTDDERGQLIYQYIRVVDECRPEVIVYENVKGIMSIDNGNTIKDFVQALRDIGYHCHYSVVNTKDYGVPQNRERLFLVGFLDDALYHRFDFAPTKPLEKRLKDVLEDDVDEKYYLSKKQIHGFQNSTFVTTRERLQETDICRTLCARDYKGPALVKDGINMLGLLDIKGTDQIRRVYGVDGVDGVAATLTTMQGGNQEPKIQVKSATKQGYETATTGDSINLSVPNSKTRRGRVGKQVAQTLDTACNQAVVEPSFDIVGNIHKSGYGGGNVFSEVSISPCLVSMGENSKPKIYTEYRIRKLTPRECLRLQDFNDDFMDNLIEEKTLHFQVVYGKINKKETRCNVKLTTVKEKQKQTDSEICVLCTTKEKTKLDQLIKTHPYLMQEQKEKNQNVNIAIEKLGESERKGCATNTIKWTDCTETLFTKIISQGLQEVEVILEKSVGKTPTEKSWKITLEDCSNHMRLFTTLIVLRQIIELKIYTYVKAKQNTLRFISNSTDLKSNSSQISISGLRMDYIEQTVSDSMIYKQAGNSMSVNILEMIFNQIEKAKVGECRNSLLDFMGENNE